MASVASVFISRWDVAANARLPAEQHNRLGIAIAGQTYRAYRELLASPRWEKLAAAGAWPQRVLWASTGSKDPKASDTLYVDALGAPDTLDTIPEKTLLAVGDHGKPGPATAADAGDADAVLASVSAAGVDLDALAPKLPRAGAAAFVKSWKQLLQRIADKQAALSGKH